jgi:RND family efflux transporter MFP subunit
MNVQETEVVRPTLAPQPNSNESQPSRPKHRWWIAILAFAAVAALIIFGILPRIQARSALRKETDFMAIPTVTIVQPKRTAPGEEIVLPANVQAYIDSPIYARTNGYLKAWFVDIGAHVKTGQLLATIETPEVDQQLRQARADLNTAQANLNLAEITANRYEGLLKTDSVSKQDADNAEGAYAAQKATVQSGEANVKRLEELQSFEKIYAPFNGVITARNTDIGALIDSGSSGGTRTELFHIAQPDKLRVYVNVPETYAPQAKPGMEADLTVPEYPGRRFTGKLVRTAQAIDQTTRTLLTEIQVENPTGTLLSGAYAEIHMKVPSPPSTFTIPVNTLLFRSEGLRIAIVNGDRAELRQISLGRDYGNEVEVLAGLTGNEAIIANPPDSIVAGEQVRIAQTNQGKDVGASSGNSQSGTSQAASPGSAGQPSTGGRQR